jgi:hydroxymethylpyrimidine pyrophosphatase-like HAD family hydrolase
LFPEHPSKIKHIYKIFYLGAYDHLILLEDHINNIFRDRVNVTFSQTNCLEVTSGSVSKGNALDTVLSSLGATLSDCIAFGDGMNDLDMLSKVGKGCIMANGHSRLKELLPNLEIIGSHDEDAVAHYLCGIFKRH